MKSQRIQEKLLQIRIALGLSQDEIIEGIELSENLSKSSISAYESGKREPSQAVLEAYARCAGISADLLTDDELELPRKLRKGTR